MSHIAFSATVVLIPFRMRAVLQERPLDPIFRDYTDLVLFASEFFLILTLALWGVSLLAEPRPIKSGPPFISIPLGGVALFGMISVFSSVDQVVSLNHSIHLLLLGAFYLYIVNEVATLDALVVPVAIQVGIQAIVGVAQVLGQHSLGLQSAHELNLDPAWSGVSIVWGDGIRSLRAYGLTDHPNILGGSFAFALLALAAWYTGNETRWQLWLGSIYALGALGLLLTFSRAGWLAFGAGVVFCALVFFKTRQRAALVRLLTIVAGALIVLAPFIWQNAPYLGVRLNQNNAFDQVAIETRSLSERDRLVVAASQIFSEHALFGIGIGALPQAEKLRYPDFGAFDAYYQPAHFVLLDVAAEIGIYGAVFYLVVTIAPWLTMWRNRKRLTFSPALVGISGALLAITLVGFFDYYTWLLAPGRLWQWLIWGLWAAIYTASFTGAQSA
ncbi:MAG: O-antigen ligase family protein [Chloroflexi bacterium]|nr:O-antigen ligase family protein [Chloroflexota bacterium]